MTQHTLFVCVLCRLPETASSASFPANRPSVELSGGECLFNQLQAGLATCDWRDQIQLQPVRCMGACSRSCVVAFAAPQKLTFILSELTPNQSVPELLQFTGQYVDCAEGKVPYKERPEAVRKGIYAVLPPLPWDSPIGGMP
ncbi:hypothetical protein BST81_11300 [Leptolyngbya sp. 'hensonii']|uniref:DUF1636 family protein n=1 Tax=Leptolyngbya sp. 'hensonii' TaxID=1922337 RepID=UPI00094FD69F|nr:DUF1636 domain-containing protein [Leptolyngbya sp. 'hensonii']OLP18304.1 hypothetical protein BST81_11300 [Leptolyngbya sp. 'hensonii']